METSAGSERWRWVSVLAVATVLALALAGCEFVFPLSNPQPDSSVPESDADTPLDGMIVIGDAEPSPDGEPAAETITISQVTGDGQTQSTGCVVSNFIKDNAWFRVYPLASSGVTGPVTITKVSLWIWRAEGTRQLELAIGPYTGGFQSNTFARQLFTVQRQQVVTVPAIANPGNLVTIALTTPVVFDPDTTPQIAIRIESDDILLGSG